MLEGMPSVTAMYVATARGIATYDPSLSRACCDPYARSFLPKPLRLLIRSAASSRRASLVMRYGTRGMLDHLALRTGVIDRAVQAALAQGARQLVLLGAGLDARSHRLQGLRDVRVFEVDHAATQQYKRERGHELARSPAACDIRYAACDFERVTLEQALHAAGFDRAQPSCVVWEGVTMYLPESAVQATLGTLSQLCAPGSTLIATYLSQTGPSRTPDAWRPGLAILAAFAEPLRFASDRGGMAARLSDHGFRVQRDTQPLGEASTFDVPPLPFPAARAALRERVVVAERIAAAP